MVSDRDIYTAPPERREREPGGASVDPQVQEMRRQARRRSLTLTLVMLVMLGVAWALVHLMEERDKERREQITEGLGLTNEEGAVETSSGALLSAPQIGELPDELSADKTKRLSALDRDRIGRAMDEVRLAKEYLDAHEWDGAEIHARQALEIWPDMNAAQRLIGFVYTQRGQFDQAIAILEKALETSPFSAETFNNLATAYMQRWDLERAEDHLITALEIRPGFAVAHMNLGLLYVIMGRYEETIDQLNQALEIVPDNVSARNNLAVALIRVNRYAEARKHLEYIIERDPRRATAYFNIAITHVYERDIDEALRYIAMGARLCSPVVCRNYLSDSDFDPIRPHPAFQALLNNLYPDLPVMPES